MKKSIFFISIVLLLIISCTPQQKYLSIDPTLPVNETYTTVVDEKEEIDLIGIINREGIQTAPFDEWYDKNYNSYQPNSAAVTKGKSKIKNVEVLAFMGTWCGDSKKGVPHFYKVMDEMGFDENNLKMVCVSDKMEKYKQSPNHEEKGMNIHRVPTFVFYKDGKEIGRIVESPVTSFEVDIAQILNDLPTTPNYKIQSKINHDIQEKGIAHLEDNIEDYAKEVARNAVSEYELNTYAYVLFNAEQIEEALLVFKINALAFPDDPYLLNGLAKAYKKSGDPELAIENYNKVLELDPENKRAKEQIAKMKT